MGRRRGCGAGRPRCRVRLRARSVIRESMSRKSVFLARLNEEFVRTYGLGWIGLTNL